jgi:hypothetical protein
MQGLVNECRVGLDAVKNSECTGIRRLCDLEFCPEDGERAMAGLGMILSVERGKKESVTTKQDCEIRRGKTSQGGSK